LASVTDANHLEGLMAHDDKDESGLPIVWPFTLGAFLIIVGLVWFQLGFAFEDVGRVLWQHYGVFWAGLFAGVVLIIAGGIYNTVHNRRRRAALQ
jgi:hypothetical protein